jgi:hypothetical protein
MNKRNWTVFCGLACALVVITFGQTLAGTNPVPVPLVPPAPSRVLLAAWAHVKSYTGTYSADIETSAAGGWHEHFAGSLTLVPMCPLCRVQSHIPVFDGFTTTTQSASGYCGSAGTDEHTQVVLTVHLASHTYDLAFIPNPGTVDLRGGNRKCTQPFARVFPVATFSIAKASLPAPAAGICGMENIYRSGAGWSETDTFHWKFAPTADVHWTIKMYCPNTINGAAPLR